MPFPTVGTPVTTSLTTATTSQVITLPAVIDPGDILLVFVRVAVAGAIAWPDASWHELFDGSDDAEDDQQAAAWKLAIGNEDSITITLTSGSGKGAAIAWAIKGANPDIRPPELGTVTIGAGGTSASLDPTAVTPTGGAKDYLFGILSGGGGEPTGVTSYPTGYTIGQATVNSGAAAATTTNCQVAGAFRQLNASTQDPGGIVYTGTTAGWTAYAIAFHPGPAVADAVTLSDSATVAIAVVPPRLISGLTPESLSLLDSVTVQRWVYVPDVTVQIVTGAAGALSISGVTDVVTVADVPPTVLERPLLLQVLDSLTVADAAPSANLGGPPLSLDLTPTATVSFAGCPTGNFTMLGWFRFDILAAADFNTLCYLGASSGNNTQSVTLYAFNGTLEVWGLSGVGARFSGSTLQAGRWYHVALVGNTGQNQPLTLYLNGVVNGTGTTGAAGTFSAQTFTVGNDNQTTNAFDGQAARIHLLASQLTAADIHELMMGRTIATADYLSWSLGRVASPQPDLSGNGRTGTVSGTTALGPPLPLVLDPTDVLTVSEAAPVVLAPTSGRFINLSGSPDAVTLTESVTVQRWVYVPDVTVVIQAPSTLLTISGLTETLTVVEGLLVVRERTLVLQATDTLTLVDAGVDVDATRGVLITEGPITVVIVTAVVSLTINLSGSPDLLVVADPLVLVQERQLLLSTADLVTLADSGSVVRETPLILTATDLLSTVDAGPSVLESPLIATAADLLTVVDASASARTSSLLVTAADVLTTADAGALVQLVQGLSLSVTDSVTLAEGLLTLQLQRLFLTVSDVVSIAESAPVVVLPVLALTAADALQVVDTVSVRLPVLNMLASDTTLVVDAGVSAQLVQTLRPSVSDTVTTVDAGLTVRLPLLLVSVSDSTTLIDISSLVRLSKLLILASDSLAVVDGGADIFRPVLFVSPAADVISLSEFILVQRGSVLVTIPHVSVLAEHRDFTKVSEVLISAVSAEHRDFLKIAEPRMTSVVAEHRDFTKVSEVSVVQVIAEHRDFTKVA